MKTYCRIMLGKKSIYAEECIAGNFIGADFGIRQDLSNHLPDGWLHFSREFIPVFLANNPTKSKVAAGLACSALWTISNDLNTDDIILSPDGMGHYHVGKIIGGYSYQSNGILPHRR